MAENNTKLNEGMYVIGGLFIAIAALMFASPSMPSMENDWVSLPLIGVPILGSLLLMGFASVVPSWKKDSISETIKYASLGMSLIVLIITTLMMTDMLISVHWANITFNQYVYEVEYDWISSIGAEWHIGLDGLSMPMVWLTALLVPITIITTWNEKKPWYYPLLVFMGGCLIGVFVALDFFMFYVFWELTLVPMFFLILNWGGDERRYAAQKFFIYTFTASVLMLLGIIILYLLQDPSSANTSVTGRSFDMHDMIQTAQEQVILGNVWLGAGTQKLLFVLFMAGFLVKLPVVPFHTWLPDAHVQAPTGGSMLLAGVMLKMGAYGMFRIPISMFPHALVEFQMALMIIGMISLFYGAWVCLGQTNLKRMVAYSSVSHMGIILLGIASLQPLGFAGALFMMFAHGLISPMLFGVAGAFKHHYHTLEIGSMRGMAKHSPWLAGNMMFSWMGSLGLPLLAGFVAEVAVLIAFWFEFGWWVIIPGLTLAITAAYYLWSMQRTIFEGGDKTEPPKSLGDEKPRDIDLSENIGLISLAILIVVFGIFPFIFFEMMSGYSSELIKQMLMDEITGRW